MSTEERIVEILNMRGVDARNAVRKETSVDVLKALVGDKGADIEPRETRVLVVKPAQTRLTKLEDGGEATAEKPKAKKAPAKKAKKTAAKKEPRKRQEAPKDGPKGEKTCPSCKETGDIESVFGYRRMKTTTKAGEKIRTAAQSHCRTCRAKKAKASKAKSKAA